MTRSAKELKGDIFFVGISFLLLHNFLFDSFFIKTVKIRRIFLRS